MISMTEVLKYEIGSSWWASYVSWPFLQSIASAYFAWKIKRKYKRYLEAIERAKRVGRRDFFHVKH